MTDALHRDMKTIEESVAGIVGRTFRDVPCDPQFPSVATVHWRDRKWPCSSSVESQSGGVLCVWLSEILESTDDVCWGPVKATFADGSVLEAPIAWANPARIPQGTPLCMTEWTWTRRGDVPSAWLIDVVGPKPVLGGNLVLRAGGSFDRSGHFLLEGKHVWHLLLREQAKGEGGAHRWRAVIPGGRPDSYWLYREVLALGFTMGGAFSVGCVRGVDEGGGEIVWTHLPALSSRSHGYLGPVTPPVGPYDVNIPNFFKRIMGGWTRTNDPTMLATMRGFRNACVQEIDVSYRELQMSLEVLARSVASYVPLLVADWGAWHRWVKAHEGELRVLASSEDAATTLVRKMHDNVPLGASGRHLERALAHFGLDLPKAVVVETSGRNPAVHRYTLPPPRPDGHAEPFRRLRAVHLTMIALLARVVEYRGPIADESDPWEVPAWWTADHCSSADEDVYACDVSSLSETNDA
jgi:hypothetical protein